MATLRPRDGARLCYGLTLLVTPDRVARSLTGSTLDQPARVVARILGARQVLQAVLLITHDRDWLRRAGRTTDLLHAATMVLLITYERDRLTIAVPTGQVGRPST